MVFKLLGAVSVVACGWLYSRFASLEAEKRLAESEMALELFSYMRQEIADYGTPLEEIFAAKGIEGGIEDYLSGLSTPLCQLLTEAAALGRGYGREELRICDRLISALGLYKGRCAEALKETRAMSRVKGFGVSAALVILLI